MESSETCELPAFFTPDEEARKILQSVKTIAVVGLSANPEKPGHFVPKYLKEHGYRVVPVNPAAAGPILDETVYPNLIAIPYKVDAVEIFRPPKDVPAIVEDAISIGAKVVWMQEGIANNAAAERARAAGLTVVMDKCMMKVHRSG